jgi:MFS family permease
MSGARLVDDRAVRGALAIPAFRRLAVAYTLNEVVDWIATIALALLVFDRTGNALGTTALFVASKFLPGLVVPAFAARAERVPVARCLAVVYVAEALVFAALVVASGSFWLPLICLLAFVDGTFAAAARAVTRGAVAAVLEPAGMLRQGNAALNLVFAIAQVGAPAAAGLLVAATSTRIVLGVAGLLFLALGALMATMRGTPQGSLDEAPALERLRAGAAYVLAHPVVRPLIAAEAVLVVLFMIAVPIEVVYAKESLGAGDAGYGVLATGWGAGVVLGSLVFARAGSRPVLGLLAVSTLAIGTAYLLMAAAPTLAAATAAAVLGGLGNGIQWVSAVTAVQEAVTSEMQARVAGFLEAIVTGAPGLGYLLGGALAALLSPRAAFAVAGAAVLAVVLVVALLRALASRTRAAHRRDVTAGPAA